MSDTPPATAVPLSPGRKTPTQMKPRTPLQERSKSQTNEGSSRLGKNDAKATNMAVMTPFPTKPQHILLPSTIRNKKHNRDAENEIPGFLSGIQSAGNSRPTTSHQEALTPEDSRLRRGPVVQLKRSVTALRDMYEAQEHSSRPSTAMSTGLRPTSSNSRLRSMSSSDGLANRAAWEQLNQVSADDLALLPSLNDATLKKISSESSFASRMNRGQHLTSSPNYRTYGSSSPKMPVYRDDSVLLEEPSSPDPIQQTSSSAALQTSSSSPNFVRLGRSSSLGGTDMTEQSVSSPNFVKLGTSSPVQHRSSSPAPSASSSMSRKRKRSVLEQDSILVGRQRPFNSSPPYVAPAAARSEPSVQSPMSRVIPSSPPEPISASTEQSIAASSPNFRILRPASATPDDSSELSSHASLQAALSSSPMPPIRYPVVRAPSAASSNLNIPKRNVRTSSNESSSAQWAARLSPVPSEWSEGQISASGSVTHPSGAEDYNPDSDSLRLSETRNESQVRIIPIEEDHHEASDELSALPRGGLPFRSPPMIPVRGNSLFGTLSSSSGTQSSSRLNSFRNSMDSRLNSMRSHSHSRTNSLISHSNRPSSSGSYAASVIVPTWARRYYSGLYHDSFQYLYPSQSNSAARFSTPSPYLQPQLPRQPFDRSQSATPGLDSIATGRDSRRSFRSFRSSLRSSIVEHIPSIILPPAKRARLEARKSHLFPGVGPLVSNPTQHNGKTAFPFPRSTSNNRRVSQPLSAADPRAHWAGIDEQAMKTPSISDGSGPPVPERNPSRGDYYYHTPDSSSLNPHRAYMSGALPGRPDLRNTSPHLHRDQRLNTGSSVSRGYGFPFNRRARFHAPSVHTNSSKPFWFNFDLRSTQVACFIIGFVLPFTWFIGAFLPLPPRPESFNDLEKAELESRSPYPNTFTRAHAGEDAMSPQDWEEMDVIAKLRLERHIKGLEEVEWQNARWWRRMNRWMCVVGVVVMVIVIVLAVIGTRQAW